MKSHTVSRRQDKTNGLPVQVIRRELNLDELVRNFDLTEANIKKCHRNSLFGFEESNVININLTESHSLMIGFVESNFGNFNPTDANIVDIRCDSLMTRLVDSGFSSTCSTLYTPDGQDYYHPPNYAEATQEAHVNFSS